MKALILSALIAAVRCEKNNTRQGVGRSRIMKYDVLSLSGNIFVFENQQCDCLIDIAHDQRGAEQKSLRLKGTENIIRYAYMPKEGLVRVNPKTGSIESGNVLAELLAVRCDDLDSMLKFFTNNGFFIPISREVYEKYEIYPGC